MCAQIHVWPHVCSMYVCMYDVCHVLYVKLHVYIHTTCTVTVHTQCNANTSTNTNILHDPHTFIYLNIHYTGNIYLFV